MKLTVAFLQQVDVLYHLLVVHKRIHILDTWECLCDLATTRGGQVLHDKGGSRTGVRVASRFQVY